MFSPAHAWSTLVDTFAQHGVLPLLQWLHIDRLAGDPREIAESLMIAVVQVAIIACL